MTTTAGSHSHRGHLDELRCAADIAAMAGAADAAVAVRYGDGMRIVGSVAGTIGERTLTRAQIDAAASLMHPDHTIWLTPAALRGLGVPPQARVLVVPADEMWDGLMLLRFDGPPLPSRYDLAAISAALRRSRASHSQPGKRRAA
ncbi:MAG: hypothetical protein J7513_06615 [Solirubrobacteraceae bacterium]|nr:hypothetical protein [Solirubrobacteraceae bacterium]